MIRRSIAAIVLAAAIGGTVAAAPASAATPKPTLRPCRVTTTAIGVMYRDVRQGYRVTHTAVHGLHATWTLTWAGAGACRPGNVRVG